MTLVNTSEKPTSLYDSVMLANPKTIPDPPPELVEFRKISRRKREEDGMKFYNQEFIFDYLDDKWKRELYNRTSFEWLHEGYLNTSNTKKRDALANNLAKFRKVMLSYEQPCVALLIDFKNYVFHSTVEMSEESKNVCDIFGGKETGR